MLSFMLLKYFNNFILWRYKFGFSITFLLFSPRHMDYHYFFLQSSNWFKSQNNWTQNTESNFFILFYFFMAVSPIAVHYHRVPDLLSSLPLWVFLQIKDESLWE